MVRLKHSLIFLGSISLFFQLGTFSFAEEKEDWVSMEFSFFNPFRPNPPALFFKNGEEFERVRFPKTIHGETVKYEGPKLLQFYTQRTTTNDIVVYDTITELTLSDWMENPLLIFNVRTSSTKEISIQVFAMELNTDNFPPGSISIVNLTAVTMQAVIDEKPKTIPPGISDPVTFAKNGIFPIGLAFEFDGRVYPAFLNTVTLEPKTRQWMFVGPPRQAGSSRVRVRFVEDHTFLQQNSIE